MHIPLKLVITTVAMLAFGGAAIAAENTQGTVKGEGATSKTGPGASSAGGSEASGSPGQTSGGSSTRDTNDPDVAGHAPGSPTEGITGTHGSSQDAPDTGASSK